MSSRLESADDGAPDSAESEVPSTASHTFAAIDLRSLDDEQLVSQLAAGINDGLTILFQRHSATVFRIAQRILRDDGEAEETVQQVFFDVFRAVKQFDPQKGNFRTWLLQFAYHRSMNRREQLKSQRVYDWMELDEALPAELFIGARRPFHLDPQETGQLIRQLLETIKPRQREVIKATFFEGLTAEEIARRLGESPAAVRHNLYRGMQKLRSALLDARPDTKRTSEKGDVEEGTKVVADPRPI